MQKQIKLHHSVSELGNLQLRQVMEYVKDGKLIDKKYGDPYTPADIKDMTGWDDRSKDIVAAITDKATVTAFKVEKQEPTGIGLEEIVKYDMEIKEDGAIAVRRKNYVFDEGERVSLKYHRSWIMPGQDPNGNDVISKAVAKKIHTSEVIAAYKATIAKQGVL